MTRKSERVTFSETDMVVKRGLSDLSGQPPTHPNPNH